VGLKPGVFYSTEAISVCGWMKICTMAVAITVKHIITNLCLSRRTSYVVVWKYGVLSKTLFSVYTFIAEWITQRFCLMHLRIKFAKINLDMIKVSSII
jgi:hypothetical protein